MSHKAGLSVGKYRAFLEVKAKNPDTNAGRCEGAYQRQIRELQKNIREKRTEDSGKSDRNPEKNRQETKAGKEKRRERKRAGKN